jgi:signal transduction histidine kinase
MLPVDMNQLIAEAIAGIEYELDRHGVAVEVAELPPCLGDADQLAQVFANLLGNAMKYLDPARPGRLEITGARVRGTRKVIYDVRDNGVGIDRAHQGKIFEIFHRLDPAGTPGDGLGLSIVQKLVALHGGRVWVDSAIGSGSTFHVELTAAESPEAHT